VDGRTPHAPAHRVRSACPQEPGLEVPP